MKITAEILTRYEAAKPLFRVTGPCIICGGKLAVTDWPAVAAVASVSTMFCPVTATPVGVCAAPAMLTLKAEAGGAVVFSDSL